VVIQSSPNNTIGGTTAAARNLISGKSSHCILISFPEADGNNVKGNYIGTDVAGTVRDPDGTPNSSDELGNGGDGVSIQADADDNTIGGTAAGAGNIISGNSGDGGEVRFDSGFDADAATGNRILSNSIYDNDALGIDLIHSNDPPDVTLNDDGDPDGQSPPLAELPGHNLRQTHNQANRRT
jgi:trimeric autotransporter adhesin